jgi:prepilin-type N-terminal cleavage/methylation domain-containing protein
MSNIIALPKSGFTLAEMVMVIAIVSVMMFVAFSRLNGIDDLPAMTDEEHLLAALQYAQTLAQRQGIETSVVISSGTPNIKVTQKGASVYLPTRSDKLTSLYEENFGSGVSVTPASDTITYSVDGIPSKAAAFTVLKGSHSYAITLTSLGYAYEN